MFFLIKGLRKFSFKCPFFPLNVFLLLISFRKFIFLNRPFQILIFLLKFLQNVPFPDNFFAHKWVSCHDRGMPDLSVCLFAQPLHLRTLYQLQTPQNKVNSSTCLGTGCKPVLLLLVLLSNFVSFFNPRMLKRFY